MRPNKRLKLAAAIAEGKRSVCALHEAQDFVHYSCAGGRVGRSLSAIR